AIRVDWCGEHGDRARGRGGALALGAVGQELRIALVQARDRVAEVVGGELLFASMSTLRVDLDQYDPLSGVGADIKASAYEAGRRSRHAEQRERVAEGRQRLVSAPR